MWLIISIVCSLLFIANGAVMTVAAVKGRHGTLPYLSPFGVRTAEVRASERAWVKAHRSVWTLMALGATLSFFHGLSLIPSSFVVNSDVSPGVFIAVLTVSGAVVVTALWILAGKAARAALSN